MPDAESLPAFPVPHAEAAAVPVEQVSPARPADPAQAAAPDQPAVPAEQAAAPRQRARTSRTRKGAAPPVLVEVRRGETVESRHRGHIVEVDARGRQARVLGAPSTEITLRSTVKPFGVVALVESGAAADLSLTAAELAIMAASHTGEDKHVRTLQAIFRRANVTQALLRCGTTGAPADVLTAARLARDGETPGAIRHGCSGFHAASILLSAYAGWSLEDYHEPGHPSQKAVRETVAAIFGREADALVTASDNCGLLTYQATLAELAKAYLLLADPEGPAVDEQRARFAPALARVRDAMMAAPEMVGGTFDHLDTELMRRRPGRLVAKAGADGLRAIGIVAADGAEASAIVIKIEDGDLSRRASKAASVEALAQVGLLDERDLRALADYHHPIALSPQGVETAVALPRFALGRRGGSGRTRAG